MIILFQLNVKLEDHDNTPMKKIYKYPERKHFNDIIKDGKQFYNKKIYYENNKERIKEIIKAKYQATTNNT